MAGVIARRMMLDALRQRSLVPFTAKCDRGMGDRTRRITIGDRGGFAAMACRALRCRKIPVATTTGDWPGRVIRTAKDGESES